MQWVYPLQDLDAIDIVNGIRMEKINHIKLFRLCRGIY